jgi:hypothetical protein
MLGLACHVDRLGLVDGPGRDIALLRVLGTGRALGRMATSLLFVRRGNSRHLEILRALGGFGGLGVDHVGVEGIDGGRKLRANSRADTFIHFHYKQIEAVQRNEAAEKAIHKVKIVIHH